MSLVDSGPLSRPIQPSGILFTSATCAPEGRPSERARTHSPGGTAAGDFKTVRSWAQGRAGRAPRRTAEEPRSGGKPPRGIERAEAALITLLLLGRGGGGAGGGGTLVLASAANLSARMTSVGRMNLTPLAAAFFSSSLASSILSVSTRELPRAHRQRTGSSERSRARRAKGAERARGRAERWRGLLTCRP